MTENLKELLTKEGVDKHIHCEDFFDFAKDLTLEEVLTTCERGDWILRLFQFTSGENLIKLTLAKAHCANTVRHLMKDERITKAIDVAIRFGNNEASEGELKLAYADAVAAKLKAYKDLNTPWAAEYAAAAAAAAAAAYDADKNFNTRWTDSCQFWDIRDEGICAQETAHAAWGSVANALNLRAAIPCPNADAARKANQKLTADICRRYLPLEIWDQSKI